MKTLYRYIFRELLPPTLMGFGLFTFVLLMNYLLKLAEMIIEQGVGAREVGLLFLYSVPHTIVITVPMAVLLGGLIAFGRLSSDSEIVAMRSGGISLYHLALPMMLLAGGAWMIDSWLSIQALPWGNNQLLQLQWQLVNSRTISEEVKPRVWNTEFPNVVLWVEQVTDAGDKWHDVMLARTDRNPPEVYLARRGIPAYDEADRAFWLHLEDAVRYSWGANERQIQTTSIPGRTSQLLLSQAQLQGVGAIHKNERAMGLAELEAEIAERRDAGQDASIYLVEWHKKFTLPVACLVLGLLAVPLGVSTQRHTKATGFGIAIVVIAVYYTFIENGEKFAEEGALPAWLGMWAANLVLGAVALALLWSKTREIDWGIGDAVGTFWESLRARLPLPSPSRASHTRRRSAPRHRDRFPRIIDRYVLRYFLWIFAPLALGGLMTIWTVFDYFERSDDFFAAGKGGAAVLEYIALNTPYVFYMVMPIALLVTVVTTFSLMSKNNEVVAVLAGGTSVYRLVLPVLLPALLLTGLSYALQDYVLPHTRERVDEIMAELEERPAQGYTPARGHWARGGDGRVYRYADYDQDNEVFQGLYVYYLAEEVPLLTRVEYAERATWRDGRWVAENGWRQFFGDPGDTAVAAQALESFRVFDLPIREAPEYFSREQRLPEQMTTFELLDHIDSLEQQGFDATPYRVDFHQKLAFPSVAFVLALVGIPFGFRMGRQGTFSGVAIALLLAMLFWGLFVLFRAVGYAELLPPPLAAWAPHVLFLSLAGYLTLGLKT